VGNGAQLPGAVANTRMSAMRFAGDIVRRKQAANAVVAAEMCRSRGRRLTVASRTDPPEAAARTPTKMAG
jgi:hypothetical protein